MVLSQKRIFSMPKFLHINPITNNNLEQIGFSWYKDKDGEYLVRDKLVIITENEAKKYAKASNELYNMYEKAAQYVIDNSLFDKLDIPSPFIKQIKYSWQNERENHLYGRFDLSGGIDGKPIKLIEFNADTPTLLFETTIIQYMELQYNQLLNIKQFNNIYETISLKFAKISKKKKAEFTRFLFSSVKDIQEEYMTVKLLQSMAKDKNLATHFEYLENVNVENDYDFWFKLYPWEDMENFTHNSITSMLNPAYTILYQSKGMLAILYELFPNSPYLLKTAFAPIAQKYVKKRMFGREGANIDIVNEYGELLKTTNGIYSQYKAIYQEYTDFVKDEEGFYYQAGVFFSDEACGIGFRRGEEILDDMSKFIGHIVKSE